MTRAAWLILTGIVLAGCGSDRLAGGPGAGGETTNGLSARIVDRDGLPVAGARVVARIATSRREDSLGWVRATSDSTGVAYLALGATHEWTVEASSPDGAALAAADRTGPVLELALSAPARLIGTVHASGAAWVRLPGLGREVLCDSLGRWSLDSVPVGRRLFSVEASGGNVSVHRRVVAGLQPAEVNFASKSTLPEDPADWTDSVVFVRDRAGLGRDTAMYGELTLLRLDSSNFDFSRSDGADLRVLRGGRIMPHAVARWDRIARRAWVWALLDTISTFDSSWCVVVRYGNPLAADRSEPELLNAFLTPWPELGFRSGGVSGAWDTLEGRNLAIRPMDPVSGAFTVSVWVRPSASASPGSCLACGLDASGRAVWGIVAAASDTTRVRWFVGSDTTPGSYPMVRDVWVHVSATWDPTRRRAELSMNGYFEQGVEVRNPPPTAVSLRALQAGWRGSVDGFRLDSVLVPSVTRLWRARNQSPDLQILKPTPP